MIDEGIEQLAARGLGTFLAIVVADLLERTAFILELEVIPVLAPHKYTGIAVLEFQVMNPLEDLGEGFALAEVQAAVVAGARLSVTTITDTNQITVGIAHAPTGTNGQGGIELPFEFPDVE
ncbi:hypothetical protein D9M71_53860 [compost metagenome]